MILNLVNALIHLFSALRMVAVVLILVGGGGGGEGEILVNSGNSSLLEGSFRVIRGDLRGDTSGSIGGHIRGDIRGELSVIFFKAFRASQLQEVFLFGFFLKYSFHTFGDAFFFTAVKNISLRLYFTVFHCQFGINRYKVLLFN